MGKAYRNSVFLILFAAVVLASTTAQQSNNPSKATAKRNDQKTKSEKAAAPFEFKGIRVGMNLDEARPVIEKRFLSYGSGNPQCGKYSGLNCVDTLAGAHVPGVQHCGTFSYCTSEDGDTIQSLNLGIVDGRISRISYQFPTEREYRTTFDDFGGIKSAALEKYGKPDSVRSVDVQTKGGAHYKSEEVRWDNGVSRVELVQLCTDIETSCLTVTHKDLGDEEFKRGKAANKPEI
jgi:hypothetical protein